ncbi:hypothetical protein RhiirC2_794751 [Rhizophagus irregularis]|uniref:Uncharacterized protein n=1 Tax=Rhizophagus irregularis TaxID=588596 RepID=A0A2N1MD04_9GLOM|nr:hypothetical protein RhiirC2_794751 [Rhizophagus irregularis]
MKDTWDKFDDIIDNLLNFQTSFEGQLLYNTDFDMAAIHQKILENIDHGCLTDAPNIVILETGRISKSNKGIFQSTEINLQKTNKTEKNIAETAETNFNLAKVSGIKFLDKLDKIVDYRSTIRILKLIWYATSNFKAHCVEICVSNYKLQKNALICFAGLFTSAEKLNYLSSVTQYDLGMLGHYFAFDEAFETFRVKFIKQNITRNVVDDNKLKLQVKVAQSERDRIGILLSEYLNNPCKSIRQKAIDTRKTAI